jgi:hypothetical protein
VHCVNQREDNGDISIVMQNVNEEMIDDNEIREWTIHAASFDVALNVGPLKFKPGEVISVPAALKEGITWKNELELIRPTDMENELELLGFNVLGNDKMGILLRNNSGKDLVAKARTWTYVDNSKSTPCRNGNEADECLIYSYLVLEPESFNNPKDNKILGVLQNLFAPKTEQGPPPKIINNCVAGACSIER